MGCVAWYALGQQYGLLIVDICQIILLLGIIVAYVEAVLSFIYDIELSFQSSDNIEADLPSTSTLSFINAIVVVLVMTILSTAIPNIGTLSGKLSILGLFVLIITFSIIAIYGIITNSSLKSSSLSNTMISEVVPYSFSNGTTIDDKILYDTHQSLNLIPSNITSQCHWFGISVFGYGVVPITYSFYESMNGKLITTRGSTADTVSKDKALTNKRNIQFIMAAQIAFSIVAVLYSIIGIGLYTLFPSIHGDILQVLPTTIPEVVTAATGSSLFFPILARIMMTITIILSSPLLIIPCAELFENKIPLLVSTSLLSTYWIISIKFMIRFGIIGFCAFCAILVPGFVEVLSLVGCFCIATAGFCLPPLLHLRLLFINQQYEQQQQPPKNHADGISVSNKIDYNSNIIINNISDISSTVQVVPYPKRQIIIDTILLIWGIFSTVVSTLYVLRQMML
jgi:hypothetical protein